MVLFDKEYRSDGCEYLMKKMEGNDRMCNLSIRFGRFEDDIFDVDGAFDIDVYDEWLKDPFVKQIVEDIDKCECMEGSVLKGEFGTFAPTNLSSGTKALILMYEYPEFVIDATRCGDNCAKWILEISKIHPITITLRYYMELENIEDFYCINSEKVCHGYRQFADEYLKWKRAEAERCRKLQ